MAYNKGNYNKNTSQVSSNKDLPPTPGLQRTKTDGRSGSATPPKYLKGGLTVNNNKSQQPHHGEIGSAAASHMSAGHQGDVWAPRVAKSRKVAGTARHGMGIEPQNHAAPALKRMKPS